MGIITTNLFWDCECNENYIHKSTEAACPECGARREDCADARANEVEENAEAFGLDAVLVNQVKIQRIITELGFLPWVFSDLPPMSNWWTVVRC